MRNPNFVSEVKDRKEVYISEMAVSNKHGGGLTLQRVLGKYLRRFQFIHIGNHYKFAPYIDGLKENVKYIDVPFHRPPRSKVISYAGYMLARYVMGKKPRNDCNVKYICDELLGT